MRCVLCGETEINTRARCTKPFVSVFCNWFWSRRRKVKTKIDRNYRSEKLSAFTSHSLTRARLGEIGLCCTTTNVWPLLRAIVRKNSTLPYGKSVHTYHFTHHFAVPMLFSMHKLWKIGRGSCSARLYCILFHSIHL